MYLKTFTLKNYRAYEKETKITFDELTTIIGKNDVGKSTILEALDIFFNGHAKKLDQSDVNINSDISIIELICEFTSFPNEITLDSSYPTNLEDEYLLTPDGTFVIKQIYDCNKKTPSVEKYIVANHPSTEGVSNLLELKEKELQKVVKDMSLDSKLKGNPLMRKAIWQSVSDLNLKLTDIPISKPREDAKRIWEQIESYLPIYALFQSDRSSSDSDSEVQDPMKAAIATAMSEVQKEIDDIQLKVKEKAEEIANNTHKALQEIDGNLASKLEPKFDPPTPAKWKSLFSIKLDTDSGIALNKRGSGVRRLILVSFFKAEAERLLASTSKKNIIYAIEEPETAQHPNNQKILIQSLLSLANENECQVILTTHSPGLASDLPVESLRFLFSDESDDLRIESGTHVFPKIAETLGVTPDSRVKLLIYLEGPTDITALCCLSKALNIKYPHIPNLENNEGVAFIISGGSTLKHWVSANYLKGLGKPQFHLYDNDVSSYKKSVDEVEDRDDDSCGFLTKKLEIESYLHKDAISAAFGFEIDVPDNLDQDGKAVPKLFGEAYAISKGYDNPLSDSKSKKKLAEKAFPNMTAEMIEERDQIGEVKGWFEKISTYL